MPKADRVHSTPPTNTPISQSNPVDGRSAASSRTPLAWPPVAPFLIRPVSAAAAPTGLADPVFSLRPIERRGPRISSPWQSRTGLIRSAIDPPIG
jgi:hypothetical protein